MEQQKTLLRNILNKAKKNGFSFGSNNFKVDIAKRISSEKE